MTEKIIGVYKITNTVTGDFYIGSSKNGKNYFTRVLLNYDPSKIQFL